MANPQRLGLAATRSKAPNLSMCWKCSSPTRRPGVNHLLIGEIGGSAERCAQFLIDEAKKGRFKTDGGFIAGRITTRPDNGPRWRGDFWW